MTFTNSRNNTWVLEASSELDLNDPLDEAAEKARVYLQRVIAEHPDTPWALLARSELDTPFGWTWTEDFTDLTPRSSAGGGDGGGGTGRGRDDRQRTERPAKRPVPKL
jgi:hypothetical protein